MSKKSKKLTKDNNKKAKAAKKARQQAQYDAWRAAGQNQKSKRNVLRGKRRAIKTTTKHRHLVDNCGNVGCNNCFPRPPLRLFGAGSRQWLKHQHSLSLH